MFEGNENLDRFKKFGRLCAAAILLASVSACATPPTDPEALKAYEDANDPLEPFNRTMFGLHNTVDAIAIKPTAAAYDAVVPEFIQDMFSNFLTHLKQPIVFANSLLQGNVEAAGDTLGRFMFNTFAGVGGLFDPASGAGIKKYNEDFGQTLAVWGVPETPYLFIPLFGPTTVRDGVGSVVDYYADPFNHWAWNTDRDGWPIGRSAAEGFDFRARNLEKLDELEKTSIDFYATIRSIYRQQRRDAVYNGVPQDLDDPYLADDGNDDLFEDPASVTPDQVSMN